MSEFMPRNKWNEHLSESKLNSKRRKAYLRECASLVSGSREETNRIAAELEADEYFEQCEREYEDKKKRKQMTDEELDALVDDLMNGGDGKGVFSKKSD